VTRGRQAWVIGALALLSAAIGLMFYRSSNGGAAQPDPAASGRILLAATLTGLDGKPQPLEQWRGKVLIVNFWATWCAPCREEIPGFIKFQKQYGARGLQFVGIAIDTAERVTRYAEDIGINYPVLVGGIETMNFARQAGNKTGVLPFTLILDRSGKVISSSVGILRPEKLEILLKPLL
jgi:thiol-disulfide isomerase/thioredoxin